jgi:hypothetical protein
MRELHSHAKNAAMGYYRIDARMDDVVAVFMAVGSVSHLGRVRRRVSAKKDSYPRSAVCSTR